MARWSLIPFWLKPDKVSVRLEIGEEVAGLRLGDKFQEPLGDHRRVYGDGPP